MSIIWTISVGFLLVDSNDTRLIPLFYWYMRFLNTDNRITPAESEFALWENAFIQDWFDKYTWTADGRITISGARTDTRSYLDISKTTQWKGNLKIILEKKTHVISWGLHVTKNLVCWSIRCNWPITTWNCKKRNDIRQWYKRSCPEAVSLISRKWLQDNFQGLYHFRVVKTQAILYLKSMSDPPLSDIDFKNEMAWVWTALNRIIEGIVHSLKETPSLSLF